MSKLSKKAKRRIKEECQEVINDLLDDVGEMVDGMKTGSERELEELVYENLKARIDSCGDLIELAMRNKGEPYKITKDKIIEFDE